MDATDLQNRLKEFQATANEVLSEVKDITPQQIKHWIVSPLLVALGWDPHDKRQVYLDFPIKKGDGHADYALLDPAGKPKLVLEVYGEKTAVRTAAQGAAEKAKSVEAPLV
ncbi:MAG TPA: hypothetical protein VLY85_02350, partial [Thermoplasmata archaeon]|nr:hypothetical protein [Thermoplasmata archaeon]